MLELRVAQEDDFDFLWRAQRAGLKVYVAEIWGWDEHWQARRFRDRFDLARYQVIQLKGQDIGFLAVERHAFHLYLADIVILSEFQGQSIGTAVIQQVLAEAGQQRQPVRLQVLKVNPAKRLYQRLRFQPAGKTEAHYLMIWRKK